MNITIKPLTPELSADYFDFFENRAFTDDSPYRCYCQMYQMTKEQAKAALDNAEGRDPGRVSREVAERQIDSGILRGYLAFVDGVAIGWCNANDKANFPIESCTGARFHAPAEKREKGRGLLRDRPRISRKGRRYRSLTAGRGRRESRGLSRRRGVPSRARRTIRMGLGRPCSAV